MCTGIAMPYHDHLALPMQHAKTPAPAEYVQLIEQLDDSPVTSSRIRNWTRCDPELSWVQRCMLTGWPDSDQSWLSIYDGCIMRGCRIIVPEPGQSTMLKLLHSNVTPQCTAGISSCKLLKRRQLRTIPDAVQPSVGRKVHQSQAKITNYYNQKSKERCFSPGEAVYVRNPTDNSPMWIPAVLKEMHNDLFVSEATDGRRLRRHSNHVRLRHADVMDDRILADMAAPAEIHQPWPIVTSRVKTILATTSSIRLQRNRLFADRTECGKLPTDCRWKNCIVHGHNNPWYYS